MSPLVGLLRTSWRLLSGFGRSFDNISTLIFLLSTPLSKFITLNELLNNLLMLYNKYSEYSEFLFWPRITAFSFAILKKRWFKHVTHYRLKIIIHSRDSTPCSRDGLSKTKDRNVSIETTTPVDLWRQVSNQAGNCHSGWRQRVVPINVL